MTGHEPKSPSSHFDVNHTCIINSVRLIPSVPDDLL